MGYAKEFHLKGVGEEKQMKIFVQKSFERFRNKNPQTNYQFTLHSTNIATKVIPNGREHTNTVNFPVQIAAMLPYH